jgi:hypothetical protein
LCGQDLATHVPFFVIFDQLFVIFLKMSGLINGFGIFGKGVQKRGQGIIAGETRDHGDAMM